MSVNVVPRGGKLLVTIPAAAALAVQSSGIATISSYTTYAQEPPQTAWLANTVPGDLYVTSTYANGATLQIEAPYSDEVYYEIGTAPTVQWIGAASGRIGSASGAGAAQAVNVSATLTVANLLGQIITSSTAAAVTGTLMTGTVLDAGASFSIGDWFEFAVINTGGTNAFTVATASGWTLVGSMTVALTSSARFRVVKTAANTFTCYRVA